MVMTGLRDSSEVIVDPPAGAVIARPPDPELLDLGLAAEREFSLWQSEFRWLLRHPAVAPVGESAEPEKALTLGAIAGQQAARFPLVSGDAQWLRERSMTVVARRLAPFLAAGGHVGLDLSELARGEAAPAVRSEQLQLVTEGLRTALPRILAGYGLEPARLTLSANADHPGLAGLLALRRCAALGRPRIVARVPDALMLAQRGTGSGDPQQPAVDQARLWRGLTGLAWREPGIRLVFQHTTRPTCALAGGERGDAILPVGQFEVRADSAWLSLGLRLDALQAPSMRAGSEELRRVLRSLLRLADNLVEQIDWPTPELAQDAIVNRRLALHVTGIGNLVDRRNLDPAAFSTVRLVVRGMRMLRALMLRESNRLARERGPFPGLELRGLEASLTRCFGDERARRLLRQAGTRHRHLLVVSPYSVFPEDGARRPLPAYLHLLPALRWADTIGMHGEGVVRRLPLPAFQRLLQMTWAIARNRP
jgi:hypothetical protein